MNGTTKRPITIDKDSFFVYCKEEVSVEVIKYTGAGTERIQLFYEALQNGLKRAEVDSSESAYYFVRSGKNSQMIKRGKVPPALFLVDPKGREDLELEPKTYLPDGTLLDGGYWEHIGFGIYVIKPVTYSSCIVEVFGRIYSANIIESNDGRKEAAYSQNVTLNTSMSLGPKLSVSSPSVKVQAARDKASIHVGQQVFTLGDE